MEYILIAVFTVSGRGSTSQAILFDNQQSCEVARVASKSFESLTRDVWSVCVPRKTP